MSGFLVLHYVSNILLLSENILERCKHPVLLSSTIPTLQDFCSLFDACSFNLMLRGQRVPGNWSMGFLLPDRAWLGDETNNCGDWLPEPSERYLRALLTTGEIVSCDTEGLGLYCLLE